jgi:hypothetical protein
MLLVVEMMYHHYSTTLELFSSISPLFSSFFSTLSKGYATVPSPSGERLHCPVPHEHVMAGKTLRLVGRTAGCRSDCVGDLSTAGRTAESLLALRSGLLRGPGLRPASGSIGSCCGQVVGDHHFRSSGTGNEGQMMDEERGAIADHTHFLTFSLVPPTMNVGDKSKQHLLLNTL